MRFESFLNSDLSIFQYDSNIGDMGAEKEKYAKLVDKVTGGKEELQGSRLTAIAGNVR